ncbi:hypothetical protein GCM10010361_46900 [Streptomyces olivaceiscleroticus]|uniref:Uncharacterized protein n=1 Tax=Streptomyces olivaceiscleroticus TaxID=68245 RepID=A0ABN1AI11_9ACTN
MVTCAGEVVTVVGAGGVYVVSDAANVAQVVTGTVPEAYVAGVVDCVGARADQSLLADSSGGQPCPRCVAGAVITRVRRAPWLPGGLHQRVLSMRSFRG